MRLGELLGTVLRDCLSALYCCCLAMLSLDSILEFQPGFADSLLGCRIGEELPAEGWQQVYP